MLGLGAGCYLEIIAPDPVQPPPSGARPFGLDALERPQLVGWALRCEQIQLRVREARQRGYDPGDPIEMRRTTPDGGTLRWWLTLNAVEGGLIPFLIDWNGSRHPSVTAPGGLVLASFNLEHPSPASIHPTLGALGFDVRVVSARTPALVAVIDGPLGRTEVR